MSRDPSSAAQKATASSYAMKYWTESLVVAAQHLGVQCSPEHIRNAYSWARQTEFSKAIVDIGMAAGLTVEFAEVSLDDLSVGVLPVLVNLRTSVGVIVAIDGKNAEVLSSVNGKKVKRVLSLEQIAPTGKCQVLLVQPRVLRQDNRLGDYIELKPRSWLSTIFAGSWRTVLHLGAGSIVGNLLAIATSLFAMQVWDRVVPARSINTLWVLALGVGLALVLELLIRTTRASIADHFGKLADLKLSSLFFSRALDIRNDARPRSPGQLISQLRDLEQVRELLTSSSMGVLIDMPFVIAFLAVIWVVGGNLVLVPLVAIPVIILPGILAQFPLVRLSQEGLRESGLRNAVLMESIYRVEDIKMLQAETRFTRQWNELNQTCSEIGAKQRFLAALLMGLSQMTQQLAYVGVLIVGVYGILNGSLSYGAVLACSMLTSRTVAPLAQIVAVLSRIQHVRASKSGLDRLMSLPLDHDPSKERFHKATLAGGYEFQQVAYAYDPEHKPALVLPNVKISPGERVAILGKVGSGKSTLLRLAAGLSAPTAGRILLDGTPMESIDMADIRRDVGAVRQESDLFYGTLRENMLLGNPLASDEDILAAMHVSGADQLLANQPQGLDLKIQENGQGLSEGQKQVVLMARTILRSPQVLLLDEPTASLDQGTEIYMVNSLKKWLGHRTLIVATHRYPVLALVDRIIVLHDGRVVKDGPRDEVLKSMLPPTPGTQTGQRVQQGAETNIPDRK